MKPVKQIFIYLLLLFSSYAQALSLQDLWKTQDQQAQELMNKAQFKKAEKTFQRPDWSAAAAYKSGNYKKAENLYKRFSNETAYYNRGNALAHLGQYEQALKAYDKALTINPYNEDALYNRKIIENLIKQEKQKKQQQNQDQQNQDQQNKDQQAKDKKAQEQQKPDAATQAKNRENRQAKEQWFKEIPDDPGGLLRQKFLRDYLRRQRGWDQ